jgi:hypothetical protein
MVCFVHGSTTQTHAPASFRRLIIWSRRSG